MLRRVPHSPARRPSHVRLPRRTTPHWPNVTSRSPANLLKRRVSSAAMMSACSINSRRRGLASAGFPTGVPANTTRPIGVWVAATSSTDSRLTAVVLAHCPSGCALRAYDVRRECDGDEFSRATCVCGTSRDFIDARRKTCPSDARRWLARLGRTGISHPDRRSAAAGRSRAPKCDRSTRRTTSKTA